MRSAKAQNRLRAALCLTLCGAAATLITVESPTMLHAQAPAAAGRDAVPRAEALFTSAQAAAGRTAYERNCANCHGAHVDDGISAPPLRGAAFLGKYAGKPAADLFTYVSMNMPPGNPGSIGNTEYAQIIAYVLQQNGFATGLKEFASEAAALASVTIPPPPGAGGRRGSTLSPGVKLPPAPAKANPLDKITPVSDALLQNPPTGEWLTWRRGFDYQGF
ncbi:MAG: cytochrome c, partial [Acidobacteriia bacterium]|nr:cytochrome c [Terriglobia bacterium]